MLNGANWKSATYIIQRIYVNTKLIYSNVNHVCITFMEISNTIRRKKKQR